MIGSFIFLHSRWKPVDQISDHFVWAPWQFCISDKFFIILKTFFEVFFWHINENNLQNSEKKKTQHMYESSMCLKHICTLIIKRN